LDRSQVAAARTDEVMDLGVTDVDVRLDVPPVAAAGALGDGGAALQGGLAARADVHLLHATFEAELHEAQDLFRLRFGQAVLCLLCAGCATVERGTFERERWPEMELRPASTRRGLVTRQGEVFILEGDATLVSGIGGALGIRFDEERNDLAAITARFAAEATDEDAMLVLFTTFEDRGAGGPAYFVPLFNDVEGTGLGPIDQRAEFGVGALLAVINLKERSSHGDRIASNAAHELAHRHLAYFPPPMPESSTVAIEILGRQSAHWHALLHSDASLMGGHELREVAPDRFSVVSRYGRFSELDLYGLGLFTPDEVRPFFFVRNGRTEPGGAPIPEAAELAPGTIVVGERIELGIDDVIRAAGPRDPGSRCSRARTRARRRPA
jgi:hypothetical protein